MRLNGPNMQLRSGDKKHKQNFNRETNLFESVHLEECDKWNWLTVMSDAKL